MASTPGAAPSATERAWYQTSGNRLRRAFSLGSGQNRYDRGIAQQKYGWDRADLLDQFRRSQDRLSAGYNRRGVMNSGIYQGGRGQFAADQLKALSRLSSAWDQRTRGFNLADDQLRRIRDEGLSDLDIQYQALRDLRNEASVTAGL